MKMTMNGRFMVKPDSRCEFVFLMACFFNRAFLFGGSSFHGNAIYSFISFSFFFLLVVTIEQVEGKCVEHAAEVESPSGICTSDGEWRVKRGGCTCKPGYEPGHRQAKCKREYLIAKTRPAYLFSLRVSRFCR